MQISLNFFCSQLVGYELIVYYQEANQSTGLLQGTHLHIFNFNNFWIFKQFSGFLCTQQQYS